MSWLSPLPSLCASAPGAAGGVSQRKWTACLQSPCSAAPAKVTPPGRGDRTNMAETAHHTCSFVAASELDRNSNATPFFSIYLPLLFSRSKVHVLFLSAVICLPIMKCCVFPSFHYLSKKSFLRSSGFSSNMLRRRVNSDQSAVAFGKNAK